MTTSSHAARTTVQERSRFGFRVAMVILAAVVVVSAISILLNGVVVTARYLAIGGMVTLVAAQVWGFFLILSESSLKAFLALFVPGYALFALSRSGHYWLVVGVYVIGALALVAGTVMLS